MLEQRWAALDARWRKLIAFLFVGGSAAAAYILTCTALVYLLPEHKTLIAIGVHAVLVPITFFAQKHVTFKSAAPALLELLQYAGLQLASIAISAFALSALITDKPLHNLFVFFAIAGLAAFISFIICNALIFNVGKTASGAKS